MLKAKMIASLALSFSTTFVHADEACDDILETAISAAVGEPTSQYNLAVEHWRGECVDKDLSISRVLWKKAAALGIADAYNNYGFLLYYGEGGETDHEGGVAAWEQGVDMGATEAMIQLANANLDELFLKRDPRRARVLASAGKKCALLEDSDTHVDMADKVLAQTGTKLKKRDESEVEALVLKCTANDE